MNLLNDFKIKMVDFEKINNNLNMAFKVNGKMLPIKRDANCYGTNARRLMLGKKNLENFSFDELTNSELETFFLSHSNEAKIIKDDLKIRAFTLFTFFEFIPTVVFLKRHKKIIEKEKEKYSFGVRSGSMYFGNVKLDFLFTGTYPSQDYFLCRAAIAKFSEYFLLKKIEIEGRDGKNTILDTNEKIENWVLNGLEPKDNDTYSNEIDVSNE